MSRRGIGPAAAGFSLGAGGVAMAIAGYFFFFPPGDGRAPEPDPIECPEPKTCTKEALFVAELETYVFDCYEKRHSCVEDLEFTVDLLNQSRDDTKTAHQKCIDVCQEPGCAEECEP